VWEWFTKHETLLSSPSGLVWRCKGQDEIFIHISIFIVLTCLALSGNSSSSFISCWKNMLWPLYLKLLNSPDLVVLRMAANIRQDRLGQAMLNCHFQYWENSYQWNNGLTSRSCCNSFWIVVFYFSDVTLDHGEREKVKITAPKGAIEPKIQTHWENSSTTDLKSWSWATN
jgi:hypothetical protein